MNLAVPLEPSSSVFEVGLAPHSPSNLYVDLEDTVCGVFVATYGFQDYAIGTKVILHLHFPGGSEMVVPGVIEWLRLATGDRSPGCGARFERPLSMGDESLLRRFKAFREPLLFG